MEDRTRSRQANRNRNQKRAQMKRRRKRNLALKVFLFFIIIVGVIGGTFLIKRYGPSKELADLYEYYGLKIGRAHV